LSEKNLYDYPRYYDLVFGSDWKAEYDFLLKCFEHLAGRKVRRLFEPACGTGRLLYRLAKAGFDVSGLDLNPRAVQYCNRRLQRHGLPITAVVGDMSRFRLPHKVDAAFNMINSFRHLTTAEAADGHLQCMARALAKGGLYVLGLHLLPTVGRPMDEESWSARRGHLCVNTHMWTIQCDRRRRQERLRMNYDVYTPTRCFRISDDVVFRTYTLPQFRQFVAGVPEFEIAAVYDFAYQFDQPITPRATTEDAVFVLRRV
jgi:SAM-dependent methyltransferase